MNKNYKIIAVITFFAIIAMFSGTVSAGNWTVNPGGNIQSVINSASNNDVITVNDNNGAAYTYNVNLVVGKKLTIKAKTPGLVTLKATNSSKPVIYINSMGNGTTIQGFGIMGASTNSYGLTLN